MDKLYSRADSQQKKELTFSVMQFEVIKYSFQFHLMQSQQELQNSFIAVHIVQNSHSILRPTL